MPRSWPKPGPGGRRRRAAVQDPPSGLDDDVGGRRRGARGATIGRNIWGFDQITAAVRAFKAVIHDGKTADEALEAAGLTGDGG